MKIFIDRVEDDIIIAELPSGELARLDLAIIPNVKEGDVVNIFIENDETKSRKEEVSELMKDLF